MIIVGRLYQFLDANIHVENYLDDIIDNSDVEISSVYFDSVREDNIVGFSLYGHKVTEEINYSLLIPKIQEASEKFKNLFGFEAKLYLTQSIT
jgi:hypothetical protein